LIFHNTIPYEINLALAKRYIANDSCTCEYYNLHNNVSDVKLIKKILRSLREHFRIMVTTIEESKDLESMKIEKLVGSL